MADSRPTAEWRVWQLVDSAFPAGGFVHSAGLEAAWQAGWVRTAEDAGKAVDDILAQVAHGALPYVACAAREGSDVVRLDQLLETMLSNHVARRASRLQGLALLSTAAEAFEEPALRDLRKMIALGELQGHLPVVFGAVARVLGLSRELAQRMYLFMTLRGVLSAAVRLGILGPMRAQRLQASLGPRLEEMILLADVIPAEEACQTAPLVELWQMGQDRLYSRLFQS